MINYNCRHNGIMDELERQGLSLMSINGKWVASNDILVQSVIDNFDHVVYSKTIAKDRILKQAEEYERNNVKQYPQFERDLFHILRQEAQEYFADITALTPNVDIYAVDRGIDRVLLLNKIKSRLSDKTSIRILARSKKKQDLINDSTDLDFINSINFEG